MPTPLRSTSADVARRAGVSRATVSYVLNGRTDQSIPDATRQRVLDAAHQLSYVPHAASRALRAGRSRLVLLINSGVPWSTNLTDIEDGLTAAVAATGRSLVVWRRHGPEDLAATLGHLEPCVAITLDPLGGEDERLLGRLRLPLVEVDLMAGASTEPDHAAQLQVEHLASRGHTRLGYVTTSEPALQRFAEPRTSGVRAACTALGLPEPRLVALPGASAPDVEAIAAVLSEWRAPAEPVTAVACFNDLHAAACLAAAARLGIAVPDELAVIGLDDDDFAPFTHPALTTVRLQPLALAAHIWALALHALGEGPPPATFTMLGRLVERDSVQQQHIRAAIERKP